MPSGKGQDRPAVSARVNVSRTVERAKPSRRAISCVDTEEDFSRIISRASRIPIRSAGIDPPLGLPKGRPDQANGAARQSKKDPGRDHSVMGGAIISELGAASFRYRGAALSRNKGAASSGISKSVNPSLTGARRRRDPEAGEGVNGADASTGVSGPRAVLLREGRRLSRCGPSNFGSQMRKVVQSRNVNVPGQGSPKSPAPRDWLPPGGSPQGEEAAKTREGRQRASLGRAEAIDFMLDRARRLPTAFGICFGSKPHCFTARERIRFDSISPASATSGAMPSP